MGGKLTHGSAFWRPPAAVPWTRGVQQKPDLALRLDGDNPRRTSPWAPPSDMGASGDRDQGVSRLRLSRTLALDDRLKHLTIMAGRKIPRPWSGRENAAGPRKSTLIKNSCRSISPNGGEDFMSGFGPSGSNHPISRKSVPSRLFTRDRGSRRCECERSRKGGSPGGKRLRKKNVEM